MAELFNGALVTQVDVDQRISFNKPGVGGSVNQTVENFINQIQGAQPVIATLNNSQLNAGDNYSIVIPHTNNTLYVRATIFDDSGIEIPSAGIFSVPNSTTVRFEFNGPITGTYRYILTFYV